MNVQNRSKINQLIKRYRKGTVATNPWLAEQGVSRGLANVYVRSSWLSRVGSGAYARADAPLDWTGGLYALQKQLRLSVHAGGKTAFQLQGYAHFIPLQGQKVVHLFGNPLQKLPRWFLEYDWKTKIRYHMTRFISQKSDHSLTKKDIGEYSITISSLERAMMEYLYLVPQEESFEEGRLLMEGLVSLNPVIVQELLEKCNSVKVKRLFMVLAEECNHSWLAKLNLSKVDFGKGKRMIEKGGQLDQKYLVTVPRRVGSV